MVGPSELRRGEKYEFIGQGLPGSYSMYVGSQQFWTGTFQGVEGGDLKFSLFANRLLYIDPTLTTKFTRVGGPNQSNTRRNNTRRNTRNNLYRIMELEPGASQSNIRKAYRRLVIEHHPDKGGNVEKFKKLQNAYNKLKNLG
jgi:DnaJ domain